jgi:hypothetical protein
METWVIILIIVVVLCSLSSLAISLTAVEVAKAYKRDMETIYGEGVIGLGEAAAKDRVVANHKKLKDGSVAPRTVFGDACPLEAKYADRPTLLLKKSENDNVVASVELCL